MLQISLSAIKEIKRIQNNQQQPGSFLKLKVISGGCSGLFYQLQVDNDQKDTFSTATLLEIDGIKILIDEASQQYVEHLKIDYAEDLMGGGFRFKNPLSKNVCGCGMSFSLDEIK